MNPFRWSVAAALVVCFPLAAEAAARYSIKTVTAAPPQELKEPFRQLLGDQAVQLLDEKGETVAEYWFRKEAPVKAAAGKPLTYRDVPESTFLGAVRFRTQAGDYRTQKIKPGVYTLRLGLQPMDGDHMGTAPYNEFCLVIPAARDESPELLKNVKELYERSTKSTGTSHPAVMLLFPAEKAPAAPELQDKGNGHWVLFTRDGALGLGLTVIGHAAE